MGDMTNLQNGQRSKSQVSVFDYPEHLNPFYEDENHKRLRFWKIGKKDGTTSRRGSFSLGGLREMWAFKSLRGKKKSSTLGINKTSESPEPLRRVGGGGGGENIYATYDPRYRNTYDNGSVNNNFQRNVPYRASLQNMNNTKDINANGNGIGFMRNDGYRSTIQVTGRQNNKNFNNYSSYNTTPTVPARRYVYGGSITPQPRTRFDHNNSSQEFSRGSSQLSVASSTNPFEDDYDDDDNQSVMTGRLSYDEGSDRPTPATRRVRKKRRAPPPPVPIPKIITEETTSTINSQPTSPTNKGVTSSQSVVTTTPATIETSIRQYASTPTPPSTPTDPNDINQNKDFENQLQRQISRTREFSEQEKLEISNIAAEIEHYVQLLSRDEDDQSSIRLIPLPKTSTPVLKKAKSSTSIENTPRPGAIKKSGSESLMKVLAKRNSAPTRDDLNKWRQSSLKVKNTFSPSKVVEIRRNSLGRPTPVSRQRPSGSPPAVPIAGRKLSFPESSVNEAEVKPIPSVRQNSPTKREEVALAGSPKKDNLANGMLLNGSAVRVDEMESNIIDNRSESSKETTPLNSSYDTTSEASGLLPIELKITESKEDVSQVSNASSTDRYHIRYVPLKEGSPGTPPQLRHELKSEYKPNNSTGVSQMTYTESWISDNERRRPSVERRRSVKEIIESINRSQSLLKVNQNSQKSSSDTPNTTVANNLNGESSTEAGIQKDQKESSPPLRRLSSKEHDDLEETYRKASQSEAEIKRMLVEVETLSQPREIDNYCDTVPSILDRFDEEVNNNDIFKKCVLKKHLIREGSPTASNLDWNPLPKPKRSKNLSAVTSHNGNNNSNNNNFEQPIGK